MEACKIGINMLNNTENIEPPSDLPDLVEPTTYEDKVSDLINLLGFMGIGAEIVDGVIVLAQPDNPSGKPEIPSTESSS
jgi:hypothetical protein